MPKRPLVAGVTFLAGLFYLLEWLLPSRGPLSLFGLGAGLSRWQVTFGEFLQVVIAFSVALGWFQLMAIQGRQVARGRWDERLNGVAFFLVFFLVLVVGLMANLGQPAAGSTTARLWDLLFNDVVVALQSAVFSLLAFFIVTAAYRAFRVRTLEAGLLMAAAFIVMLGQVPLGAWMLSWLPGGNLVLPRAAAWILTVITSASLRAIGFGVAVGAIAMGLRIWLSLERGSYFEREL